MTFRVDVEIFRGPLDLLLYLVRKHEVDILDLPLSTVTDQYLSYVSVLEQLDVNAIGDFLEMASILLEIKSRMVLPHGDEVAEEIEDPRQGLVQQLLEYRKFKEAASMLEERSRSWQERYPRLAIDVPPRQRSLADEPIREIEMWDLVSAFGRIMQQHGHGPSQNIVYDDTPIEVHMDRIREQLLREGRVALGDLFQPGMHKSRLVGVFLAILELIRHHSVQVDQSQLFGEIYVTPGPKVDQPIVATTDEAAPAPIEPIPPVNPR